MTDQISRTQVIDRRVAPPGVLPRHLQHWVLAGISLVMIGILASAGAAPKQTTRSLPPSTQAVDANQRRIEEYERHLQEQVQRLTAERTRLQVAKDAVREATTSGANDAGRAMSPAKELGASPIGGDPHISGAAPRGAREEHALFADNVAFSRGVAQPSMSSSAEKGESPIRPAGSTLAVTSLGQTPISSPTPPVAVPAPSAGHGQLGVMGGPPSAEKEPEMRYRLFEGTIIDTVLTNRLDGTFPGPVNALVSIPVYAADGEHLVIPPGTRVLGEARAVSTFGQSRLAVVFHRAILPNGTHIDFDSFRGLNQIGDLGLRDQVDRHYGQIFGVSLAIGAIAGFAQSQSPIGFDATAFDAYRQGVAANVSQSSARILDRFLNLLPTVTIREGHRIKIYLSNDLNLPAYRTVPPIARRERQGEPQ